jgi:hypothetical protein
MTADNVTPIRSDEDTLATRLRKLNQDIVICQQTLATAAAALCRAEDGRFEDESGELACSAIRVIERCTKDLSDIEEASDIEANRAERTPP